jgi:hypothetical protein
VARLEAHAKKQAQNLLKKQKELQTKAQAMQKLRSLHEQGILTDEEFALLSKK